MPSRCLSFPCTLVLDVAQSNYFLSTGLVALPDHKRITITQDASGLPLPLLFYLHFIFILFLFSHTRSRSFEFTFRNRGTLLSPTECEMRNSSFSTKSAYSYSIFHIPKTKRGPLLYSILLCSDAKVEGERANPSSTFPLFWRGGMFLLFYCPSIRMGKQYFSVCVCMCVCMCPVCRLWW